MEEEAELIELDPEQVPEAIRKAMAVVEARMMRRPMTKTRLDIDHQLWANWALQVYGWVPVLRQK